jgi:hypothetical protein
MRDAAFCGGTKKTGRVQAAGFSLGQADQKRMRTPPVAPISFLPLRASPDKP